MPLARRLRVVLLVGILASASASASACVDEEEGGASAASAASGEEAPDCGAAPDAIIHQRACPLALVCPTVFRYGLGCPGPIAAEGDYEPGERCVLDQLASGAPGWILAEGGCGGEYERLSLHVVATGEAMLSVELVERCTAADPEACECPQGRSEWSSLDACGLRSPAYFAACLGAATQAERVACMTPENWITGCTAAAPRCTES
ncbi:MAG: hypothetical protein R3A79_17820 [Nannocystaceae bacterium]